jgi:hypothetical protein
MSKIMLQRMTSVSKETYRGQGESAGPDRGHHVAEGLHWWSSGGL